ncbi:hypothetical protein FCULG_00012617, partial [Fusarium culmorum]
IGDKDEEEIALTYPNSYEDKVAKNKIKELKGKVSNIANLIENLNKELYKEHIKYTIALIATRKDLEEILKLY